MVFGWTKSNPNVSLNMKPKSKCGLFKAIIHILSIAQKKIHFNFIPKKNSEAVETRHALHGIRWPSSNPKCLNVDFGTEGLMEKAIESTAADIKQFSSSRDERVVSSNDPHESNRERVS